MKIEFKKSSKNKNKKAQDYDKNVLDMFKGKTEIIAEIIDGNKVKIVKVFKKDINGNEIIIDDESYIFNPDMLMIDDNGVHRLHLIKDVPVALNNAYLQKAIKKHSNKNKNFGQLDYHKLRELKEFKNYDSKLLKKVLVTRFLSNILEGDNDFMTKTLPLILMGSNLIVSLVIAFAMFRGGN